MLTFLSLNSGAIAQQAQTIADWHSVVKKNPDDAVAWFNIKADPQVSSSWYQRAAATAMQKYLQPYRKSGTQQHASGLGEDDRLSFFNRVVLISPAFASSADDGFSDSDKSAAEQAMPAALQLAQSGTTLQQGQPPDQDQDRVPGWDWVYSQPGDHYTIQLFATKDSEKTGKFIQQYALSESAQVIQAVVKGTTYYKVLTGSFSEWNDAAVEIGTFPQDLRNQRPWVRKFSSFYDELPRQTTVAKSHQPGTQTSAKVRDESGQSGPDDVPDSQAAQSGAGTAGVDQASVKKQVKAAPQPETVTESTETPDSPAAQTAAGSSGIAAKPQDNAENDGREIQAQPSQAEATQVQSDDELMIAKVDLPENDEFFTNFTKKLLVSEQLSPEQKAQLTSGLNAIAAGDHAGGFALLSGLADSGQSEAQYRIALMYSEGSGVEKNEIKAFELMKSASEQGHPYAQQRLADFYTNGVGVDANSSLAAYWQQTAIDNVKKLENQ